MKKFGGINRKRNSFLKAEVAPIRPITIEDLQKFLDSFDEQWEADRINRQIRQALLERFVADANTR